MILSICVFKYQDDGIFVHVLFSSFRFVKHYRVRVEKHEQVFLHMLKSFEFGYL